MQINMYLCAFNFLYMQFYQVYFTWTCLFPQGSVSGSQQPVASNPTVQQQLVALLQTLVVQHQQRKQQQMMETRQAEQHQHDLSSAITRKAEEILQMQSSLPPKTVPMFSTGGALTTTTSLCGEGPATTSEPPAPALAAQPDIHESHIQAAILNNLFATGRATTSAGAADSTRVFQTSSDTVDQLLRGLSSRSESDSIHKLSQDTACVLPTFAKALQSSVGVPAPSPLLSATCGTGAVGEMGDDVRSMEEESETARGASPAAASGNELHICTCSPENHKMKASAPTCTCMYTCVYMYSCIYSTIVIPGNIADAGTVFSLYTMPTE